jgi:fumarate reductase flavoprotein subunit
MWDDVGVVRDAVGLERGLTVIADIEQELLETGVSDGNRAFNLTWHDWLNLRSLCETSRVITVAAQQRKNSRGAHFRSDFPTPGDLATSRYTVARDVDGKLLVDDAPVEFTIVRPGETLLTDSPRAAE